MTENEDFALEVFLEYLNAVEAGVAAAKQRIKERKGLTNEKMTVAVVETTFSILKFESQQGAKIGAYEVAYKPANMADKWQHAYNILRANNATIKDRYHGDGYEFSYWLYGEGKIYRQKLTK